MGGGLLAEALDRRVGLDALGGVDADEADAFLRAADVDDDGVAVDHADDRGVGVRRAVRRGRLAAGDQQRTRRAEEGERRGQPDHGSAGGGERRWTPPRPRSPSDALDDGAGAEAAAAAHATRARSCRRCARARAGPWSAGTAPVPPSGWPRAMAPPLGLVRSRSAPTSLAQASTTEANASLISNRSMSSIVMPVRSSRRWVASIGPVSMSTGSTPTRQVSTMRARGREAERGGLLGGHEQHGGGAVGDLRRGAGGVHAVLAGRPA